MNISERLQAERKDKIKYTKEWIIKLQEWIKDIEKQMIPKEEKAKLIKNLEKSIEHYKMDLFYLTTYLP